MLKVLLRVQCCQSCASEPRDSFGDRLLTIDKLSSDLTSISACRQRGADGVER